MRAKNTEFSREVREILSQKYIKAVTNEKIGNTEAARLLKMNQNYPNMIKNPKQLEKVPASAWERVRKWVNSGESLKRFGEKVAPGLEFIGHPRFKEEKTTSKHKSDHDKTLKELWHNYQAQSRDGFVSNIDTWLDHNIAYFKNVTKEEAKDFITGQLRKLVPHPEGSKDKKDATQADKSPDQAPEPAPENQVSKKQNDQKADKADIFIVIFEHTPANRDMEVFSNTTLDKVKEDIKERMNDSIDISRAEIYPGSLVCVFERKIVETSVEE